MRFFTPVISSCLAFSACGRRQFHSLQRIRANPASLAPLPNDPRLQQLGKHPDLKKFATLLVALSPRTPRRVLSDAGSFRGSGARRGSMSAVATVDVAETYQKCVEKLREINDLQGIAGQLDWDEMTFMPAGAAATRGAQKSSLAGVIHDKQTSMELGELLAILEGAPEGALNEVQKAVVRDENKEFVKNKALPKDFVTRQAQLSTEAHEAWVKARQASDFKTFSPFLQQWVDLNVEKARYIDPNKDAYDVLLDDYEKGMSRARLDDIFDEVRAGLVPLIADLRNNGNSPDASWLQGDFDVDAQMKMCHEICIDLGFDTKKGRLDVSVHPFTGGSHPTDVRMTTRFKSNDLTEGLTGAIHETGHAIYEQGRNLSPEWKDLCVSKALSMGVHESQSLLWERMVGLGPAFQKYLLLKMQKFFPGVFDDRTPEDLYLAINKVKERSAIRVESDEVTYTMHVVLRYEIEKGLIDGSIKVEDVPSIWNKKMKEYLGVDVQNDAEGCLQDVHWSMGALGYFPTYSLGAMNACQIFAHAESKIPDLESKIAAGNFTELKGLLNEEVHKLGSLPTSADELMEKVTGEKLNPQLFLQHLRRKYSEIYRL